MHHVTTSFLLFLIGYIGCDQVTLSSYLGWDRAWSLLDLMSFGEIRLCEVDSLSIRPWNLFLQVSISNLSPPPQFYIRNSYQWDKGGSFYVSTCCHTVESQGGARSKDLVERLHQVSRYIILIELLSFIYIYIYIWIYEVFPHILCVSNACSHCYAGCGMSLSR